jgi:hypothetical protein
MSGRKFNETFRMMMSGGKPRSNKAPSEQMINRPVDITKYNVGNGLPFFSILSIKRNFCPGMLFIGQSRSEAIRARCFAYPDANREFSRICGNLADSDRSMEPSMAVSACGILIESMHQTEQQHAQPWDFPISLRRQQSSRAKVIQKTRTQ